MPTGAKDSGNPKFIAIAENVPGIYISNRFSFIGMPLIDKINRIFVAAIAVISLFASSVSACNCSHHVETDQAATPSCHSHSHQETGSIRTPSSKSIDAPCECLTAKPAPAIIAKSEKKKLQIQKDPADLESGPVRFEPEVLIATVLLKAERIDPAPDLSRHFTGLLPSRAPPRL